MVSLLAVLPQPIGDDDLMRLANWAQLVGVVLAIGALIFAGVQLRAAARATKAQLLLALDESLEPFEDLRCMINGSDKDAQDVRTRRYIARFERMGILVQTHQIDMKTVNELYGARIRKLLECEVLKIKVWEDGMKKNLIVREFLRDREKHWKGMIYLWRELHKKKYDRHLPSPTPKGFLYRQTERWRRFVTVGDDVGAAISDTAKNA
jgi:hypothetical protein